MGNLSTILTTSVATLLITVLAGLIIEYIMRRKPKLLFMIKSSIPLKLDDKYIGANVVNIENPSSKTVKDIVIKLKTTTGEIRNGGVQTTKGLDYEIEEKGDSLELSIPFLKLKDSISITTILEGKYGIPEKPEMTVRSPDAFALVNSEKKRKSLLGNIWLYPGVTAAVAVTISMSFVPYIYTARSNQSANLALSAALIGLPNIAENYISNSGISYYNQGPYIYSLAKTSDNINMLEKYKQFLIRVLDIAPRISSSSKSAICFFIGKISQLQNNNDESEKWFIESKKMIKMNLTTL